MTPLEIMAKGFWNSFSSVDTWDELSARHKELAMKHMHAALLALAEADLPKEILDAGVKRIEYGELVGSPDDNVVMHVFHDMLKAIVQPPAT